MPSLKEGIQAKLPANAATLGPYVLLEEIGRGGMGVIYRAAHQETHELVAVKTVAPQDAQCAETLARFQREAEAAQSLGHPHLMPIYEVGSTDEGVPYFSMQLAVGGSLSHLTAKYHGRWSQIAELLIKVSRAIHQAHEQGIVHRDLKPGNILFTEDHEPLVTDFGLVKYLTGSADLTQSCAVLGTPNYVSPEQAAGKTRDVTAATDIYSLGAILFELLTGRPPFVGDNPLDVLRQVAEKSTPKPSQFVPSIPKSLEVICLRCLERKPGERYHSARELGDDLESWLAGRPIPSTPLVTRFWQGIRSHPSRLVGFVSLAVIIVLLSGWLRASHPSQAVGGSVSLAVAIEDLDQGDFLGTLAHQATEQLKQRLTNTPGLDLRAFQIPPPLEKSQVFDPLEYARVQKAQLVLTGCITPDGPQLRLTTRLLCCDTGEVVWRHTEGISMRKGTVLLAPVLESVAARLKASGQLNSGASSRASRGTASPDARSFYERAKELGARMNKSDLDVAVQMLRHSVTIDPDYAAAHALLGFALWSQADTYGETDKLPLALTEAQRAIQLDPSAAQAHRVITSCYLREGRCEEAVKEAWIGAEMNPQSAGCWLSLGTCLVDVGRPNEALPWLKRAARLEPAHCTYLTTLAEVFSICGQDEQASATLMQAAELDGNQPDVPTILSGLHAWEGRFDEARSVCQQMREHFPNPRYGPTVAAWIDLCAGKNVEAESEYASLRANGLYDTAIHSYGAVSPASALAYLAKQGGRTEEVKLFLEEAINTDRKLLEAWPRNPRVLHDLAASYAVAGESDTALRYLEEAVNVGWTEYRSTRIDPRLSSLAKFPRFRQMLNGVEPVLAQNRAAAMAK